MVCFPNIWWFRFCDRFSFVIICKAYLKRTGCADDCDVKLLGGPANLVSLFFRELSSASLCPVGHCHSLPSVLPKTVIYTALHPAYHFPMPASVLPVAATVVPLSCQTVSALSQHSLCRCPPRSRTAGTPGPSPPLGLLITPLSMPGRRPNARARIC